MANVDNLYEVLGLTPDASFEEIRSAYRQLARQMHPDVAGAAASEHSIRIHRAYETLIDPRSRRDYDFHFRLTRRTVVRQTVVHTGEVSRSVFLSSLLAEAFSTGAAGDTGPAQRIEVQPVHVELVLAPEAASQGASVRLDLPVQVICRNCQGSGLAEPFVCPACRGRGRWPDSRAVEFFLAPPIRDGQVVTLDLRAENASVGQVRVLIRLSWL
jgi:molecular chaperone DnaJ